jgi:ribosomal protein S27E
MLLRLSEINLIFSSLFLKIKCTDCMNVMGTCTCVSVEMIVSDGATWRCDKMGDAMLQHFGVV